MATLHFMPEAAGMVRGVTRLDGHTILMGTERVRAALDGMHLGTGRWAGWSAGRAIGDIVLDSEYMEPEGTASFLAAALICSKTANRRLADRLAYTEALYATHIIDGMVGRQRRPRSLLDGRRPAGGLDMVCREVLGIEPDAGRFTIPIPQYLRMAVGLGRTWKLVNQVVDAGLVRVDPGDFVRLLRNAITAYIRERITGMREIWTGGHTRRPPSDIEVPPDIAGWCERRAEVAIRGDTPPCITQCHSQMEQGVNLPHTGRFLVATYHIHAGMDDHAIGELFTGAPYYNQKTTSYHIGQIRRRGYLVPGCRWVASNGLCPACDAPHPTRYRRPPG